jgi:glycosyltransferase involved in cell wall biosynthesis
MDHSDVPADAILSRPGLRLKPAGLAEYPEPTTRNRSCGILPTSVVHLINSLHALGGAERLIGTMAHLTPNRPVKVVTLWNARPSAASELKPGAIEVVSVFPLSFRAIRKAWSMIASADVIHVHLSPAQFVGALIRRPKLFTQHNNWNGRRSLPLVRWLDRLVYSRYDRVVGVSAAVTENVEQWAGGRSARYITVRNGIDLQAFDAPPRAWSERLRDGKVRIGMAARFCSNKDHATLLSALARLPNRFELYLAGSGQLEAKIHALAGQLGVTDRVQFMGPVAWMQNYYGLIDLYVQSARYDGFSLVAVEAMAAGVPLLATDIPGLRDTVGAPDQCVPPGDAQALAHAIEAAVTDPARYEAMAQRGKRQARDFDGHRMIAEYEAIYARLAAQSQASTVPATIA